MKLKPFELALIALFLIRAIRAGWLLVADVARETASEKENSAAHKTLATNTNADPLNTGRELKKSKKSFRTDPLLARPNERLVQFESEEAYRDFLKAAGFSNLRILGTLDALRAAWIGFDDLSDFDGLLDPDETGYNYLVSLPLPPGEGQVQAGAIGFRGNALEWLGITGDNSAWGKNVVIAVIDTGIVAHGALPGNILHINLVEGDSNSARHGHGTAVASLIAGQDNIVPGVSPSASIIDVRVADSNGDSSSFKLAQGIIAAVDAGADILNISMGSYGNSSLVRSAVEYAYANGSVVVASSGNEGFEQPAFPAGYEAVIAVGAVDREGTLIDFSNTGENLDITAPGLEVYSAWTDDRYIEFTGTSASAPYVSAAIATAMSEFEMSASQAADYVLNYTNEAGAPGADNGYGLGILDVGRVTNSTTRGIYDIAAVSNLVTTNNGNSVVTVVQNQGTETISNAQLTISTPYVQVPLKVSTLSPGGIQTFEIPTSLPNGGEDFFVTSETILNPSFQDAEPENNVKSTSFNFDAAP